MVAIGMLAQAAAAAAGPRTTPGQWSPYVVGALIGVLSWLTFYFSARPLGASSAYAAAAGLLGRAVAPARVGRLKYFRDNPPKVDWEFMLVIGVIGGALLAAWTGGEVTGRWVPPMWAERFGDSVWPRLAVALAGGGLMAYGARLAGGCTSGHGISGALQLSVGSWVSLVCFFIGGIAVAMLLYRL